MTTLLPGINDVDKGYEYSTMGSVYAASKSVKIGAPKGLKATAGSKKVSVSYKNVKGAKKYEIYRSTKKTKGYKKIKTTTSSKYTDKKVSVNKKYYYKVRSVGIKNKKSSFSKPVLSGKVKKSSSSIVYITKTGKKYHKRKSCVQKPIKTSLSKAKKMKYTHCKKCYR